jgi:hypothetical protein
MPRNRIVDGNSALDGRTSFVVKYRIVNTETGMRKARESKYNSKGARDREYVLRAASTATVMANAKISRTVAQSDLNIEPGGRNIVLVWLPLFHKDVSADEELARVTARWRDRNVTPHLTNE